MKTTLALLCPKCRTPADSTTSCSNCGFVIEIKDEIIDLRVDRNFDTLLDIDAYEQSNQFVEVNKSLALLYSGFIERTGHKAGGKVLELASGSGNLTLGLLQSGYFEEVAASDISPEFMRILSARHSRNQSNTRLGRFLFDANALPFSDNQFNFVVGNSVLHHFALFENTLAETARVLKNGGMAIFGEPILDTQAFTSLAAGMIIRWWDDNPTTRPDAKTVQILKSLQKRTTVKIANMNSDRTGLASIEDKFQFPIAYLRSRTRELGFTEFHVDERQVPNLGSMIQRQISSTVTQNGGNTSELDRFDFIFSAMNEDYSEPMAPFISPLFNLFTFVK